MKTYTGNSDLSESHDTFANISIIGLIFYRLWFTCSCL